MCCSGSAREHRRERVLLPEGRPRDAPGRANDRRSTRHRQRASLLVLVAFYRYASCGTRSSPTGTSGTRSACGDRGRRVQLANTFATSEPHSIMLIDTHAHLFDDRFRKDLPAVLERAAAGVERVVCLGIDRESSLASVDIANSSRCGRGRRHPAEPRRGSQARRLGRDRAARGDRTAGRRDRRNRARPLLGPHAVCATGRVTSPGTSNWPAG